jgi:zinc protease
VDPNQRYRISIQFTAAPDRIRELVPVVMRNLDSLREHGATAEEIQLVSVNLQRTLENQLLNNSAWMYRMQEYDRLGINFDRIPAPFQKRMTSEDIRKAARKYFPVDSYFLLTQLPEEE